MDSGDEQTLYDSIQVSIHRIHGTIVYVPPWMVDFYGFHESLTIQSSMDPTVDSWNPKQWSHGSVMGYNMLYNLRLSRPNFRKTVSLFCVENRAMLS